MNVILQTAMLTFISLILCGQVCAGQKTLQKEESKTLIRLTPEQAMEARILNKLKESASFPSPRYDSGWLDRSQINILQVETTELTHNIGGNVDRYLVDIQIKYADSDIGISNKNMGGNNGRYRVDYCKMRTQYEESGCYDFDAAYPNFRSIKGAYYSKLTNESIGLRIYPGSSGESSLGEIESIRVRIWTY